MIAFKIHILGFSSALLTQVWRRHVKNASFPPAVQSSSALLGPAVLLLSPGRWDLEAEQAPEEQEAFPWHSHVSRALNAAPGREGEAAALRGRAGRWQCRAGFRSEPAGTVLLQSLERALLSHSAEERLGLGRGRTRIGWGGEKSGCWSWERSFWIIWENAMVLEILWQRQMLLVAQWDFFHHESVTLNIWSMPIFQCLGSF